MFVRWKSRLRTSRWARGERVLTAVLVESQRVPVGDGSRKAPRHKVVSYLGTIREKQEGCFWHNFDFWKAATANLDRIGITAEERVRIETALRTKVRKPTQEQFDKAEAQMRELEAKIKR